MSKSCVPRPCVPPTSFYLSLLKEEQNRTGERKPLSKPNENLGLRLQRWVVSQTMFFHSCMRCCCIPKALCLDFPKAVYVMDHLDNSDRLTSFAMPGFIAKKLFGPNSPNRPSNKWITSVVRHIAAKRAAKPQILTDTADNLLANGRPGEAVALYEEAIQKGSFEARAALSLLFVSNLGVRVHKDTINKAFHLAEEGALLGDPNCAAVLALFYNDPHNCSPCGWNDNVARSLAFHSYNRCPTSKYTLFAKMSVSIHTSVITEVQISELEKFADQDFAPIQFLLGSVYGWGLGGVQPNPQKAMSLLHRAGIYKGLVI